MTVDIYEHLHKRIAELEAALDAAGGTLKAMTGKPWPPTTLTAPPTVTDDTRIAELEAERNNYRDLNENLIDDLNRVRAGVWKLEAALDSMTIERGEAQAERDEILHDKHDRIAALEAALKPFALAFDAIKRDHPEYLQADFITAHFTPAEFADARAALSDPSGE